MSNQHNKTNRYVKNYGNQVQYLPLPILNMIYKTNFKSFLLGIYSWKPHTYGYRMTAYNSFYKIKKCIQVKVNIS